jgi:hypothetical protein
MVKVVPGPVWSVMSMVPWWRSTMVRVMTRPSPLPGMEVSRAVEAR